MESLKKYPINIEDHERDIIIDIVKDRAERIPEIWQQLLDKKNIINANSFEQGFLLAIITDKRQKVPIVWKQLIDFIKKFREDAGVKITELGNNLIQLEDNFGVTLVREKYEWEK